MPPCLDSQTSLYEQEKRQATEHVARAITGELLAILFVRSGQITRQVQHRRSFG